MAYGEDIPYERPKTSAVDLQVKTGMDCEHDWLFLRCVGPPGDRTDVFYCRRCLAKTEVCQ